MSDPIKHVVVLMLENQSFDRMLGCFQELYPGKLEGIDQNAPPRVNQGDGKSYAQLHTTLMPIDPDPRHEVEHALRQIANDNSGFAQDYIGYYRDSATPVSAEACQKLMGYFTRGQLPALHQLAENFTICDHWFSSVPGPTWTNRFFVHSATSLGRIDMPDDGRDFAHFHVYDHDTIYDRLDEAGRSWRIYHDGVAQSWAMTKLWLKLHRYAPMTQFVSDCAGPADQFPEYVFIEPRYYGDDPNDDHPPHNPLLAQQLIADTYNAIRANEELWKSSLLVILYDEHGGFYDHVSPPSAVPPDHLTKWFAFDRLGVRVPALLVSPWVEKGVCGTQFDHTSLIKYLCEKWKMRHLTKRDLAAQSFAGAIRTTGNARDDTPARINISTLVTLKSALPEITGPAEQSHPLDGHAKALIAMMQYRAAVDGLPNGVAGTPQEWNVAWADSKLLLTKGKSVA